MADSREFVLIGSFTDNITPSLERINKQLATLKTSLSGTASRKNTGFRGATNDIGKLVSAHKKLSESVKEAQSSIKSTTDTLREYRLEMAKAARATRNFQTAGGNLGGQTMARDMQLANRYARSYLSTLRQIAMLSGRARRGPGAPTPPPPPRTPRGGGYPGAAGGGHGGGPRPPRGGGAGGGPGGFHMAEFGFAFTLGSAIANPIQNAIVSGFQIGIGLLTKPFQYFANNFGERMQDEMSDLKAAGGFFSIAREQGDKGFVKTFRDAVDFTQENNRIMDRMAATLPGVTEEYVEVSKRISDSVARLVANDPKRAAVYAETLRKAEPQYFKEITQPITSLKGEEQQKAAIQTILADLTKSTVLAGQGGRTGAGGMMGAYGLPQLTERMLSQQNVSMGQFQRYSAIFSDPMVMAALEKEIPKIQKTAASSVERAIAIKNMYERVLPPELIAAYRRTMAGVTEGFRTALVGKESGLFGLGRPLDMLVEQFDEYGQTLKDASGKVKTSRMGLYNFVRDMLANLGQVFQPIAENITLMYDPLKEIAKKLADARLFTFKLLKSFNYYLKGFQGIGFAGGEAQLRASLATIANLLRFVGAIDTGGFEKYIAQLKSKNVDFGAIMTGMIDQLLNSEAASKLGETIGNVVGTVFTEVAKATGFISGRIASSNKLFEGLKKGFEAAGGPEAFTNIFKDLFSSMGKVLLGIARIIPLQAYVLAAAMLILPAAIQGVAMAIASGLSGALFGLTNRLGPLSQRMMTRAAATQGLGHRGRAFGTYQGAPQRYGRGGSIDRLNRMRRYKMGQVASFAGEVAGLGYEALGRPGASAMGGMGRASRGVRRLGRRVPGGALAAGAIDMGIAMASGEDFGKAAVGAIGTVLGGTIGTIFGPAGTVIGSIAGGLIADASSDFIIGVFDQNKAAAMQLEAARKQVEAASRSASEKYGPEFGGKLGGIEALNQAMGGGAGIKKYAAEQLQLGNILPEQAQQWDILGTNLIQVNTTTDRVKKAQAAYDTAVRLNTGKQAEYKGKLEAAQNEQKAALSRITQGWEQMSANSRSKILSGADNIKAALDEAANKIRGWKGVGPPLPPKPSPLPAPSTSDTPIDGKAPPGVSSPGGMALKAWRGNLGDAISSEMKHKPPGSKLVIANSSETIIPKSGIISAANGYVSTTGMYSSSFARRFSAPSNVTNNITINQLPGQDSEELASIVAMKIGDAVAQNRAASVFV